MEPTTSKGGGGLDQLEQLLATQQKALADIEAFKAETGSAVKEHNGKLIDVQASIDVLRASVDAMRKAAKDRTAGLLPGVEEEQFGKDGFSIVRLLFDAKSKERAVVSEYTQKALDAGDPRLRDLSQGTDTAGGFLVPQVFLGDRFLDALRARAVVWPNAGITVLDNLKGSPVLIPREVGNTTVAWLGENAAPTGTDVTFGQMSLSPKRLAGLVKVSNRLTRMGTAAETIVRRNLSRSLGLEIDRVLLRGSGAGNEPRGIANTAGINNVEIDTNGGPFTFKVAADMTIAVDETNAIPNNQAYVGHPRAFHSMKTERIAQFSGQTAGAYVILPMSDQMLSDHLGYPFLKTTVVPKNLTKGSGTNLTEVYFGNWADLYLALWQDIVFKASDVAGDASGSAFTQDQVWILAQMEADVAVSYPESFSLVNDATTT